jgi:hypothetical protein
MGSDPPRPPTTRRSKPRGSSGADDNLPEGRACGTMEAHHRLLERSALYSQNLLELEEFTSRSGPAAWAAARRGVTTIPVVVHVVASKDSDKLSDEQVKSQIEVLNEDFRAHNADRKNVPAVWKDLIADCQVEFALAKRDPNNAASSGIVRVKTSRKSFTNDDSVKSARGGGADPWPSDRYLNIWTCALEGVQGYTHFPGGPASTDGVVIRASSFGRGGSAVQPFDRGRTATHEIGYWLNLRHTWGDVLDCSSTDNVDDTPNQKTPNYGKPTFPHVSCKNGPHGDMFMNYMDYVDDSAMHLFTIGQAARIGATLTKTRTKLGT